MTGRPYLTYPPEVLDYAARLYERGDRYTDIADSMRKTFKIPGFNKNNVAAMINRLRANGRITSRRVAGDKLKKPSIYDSREKPKITLPKIPGLDDY